MRRQLRVGPVALISTFKANPVAGRAVARLVADVVDDGPGATMRSLAGPEQLSYLDLARAGAPTGLRLVPLPVPLRGARRGLLAAEEVPRDSLTLADWLESTS